MRSIRSFVPTLVLVVFISVSFAVATHLDQRRAAARTHRNDQRKGAGATTGSDPVLLGDQTVESIPDGGEGTSQAFGYTATTSGTATTINVYLNSTDGVHVGLYADNGSKPGALLDEGSVSSNSAGWVSISLNGGVSIQSGTRYWIAVAALSSSAMVGYPDAGNSGSNLDYSGSGVANPYSITGQWNSNPASAYVGGTGATSSTTSSSSSSTSNVRVLFGDQTVESNQDSNLAGVAQAFQTTNSTSGTAKSISMYVDSANTTSRLTVGLYADNSGQPGSLLASGSIPSPTAGAWNVVPISPTSVSSGRYWIAVLGEGGTLYYRDRASGTTCTSAVESQNASTLPASWSTRATYPVCPVSAYVNGLIGTSTTTSSSTTTSPRTTSSTTTSSSTTSSSGSTSRSTPNCAGTPGRGTPDYTSLDACGYPSPVTTGVPAGTHLTPSGSITASTVGETINAMAVSGTVEIAADNVTLENSDIANASGCCWAVVVDPGVSGTVIKNDTIHGTDNQSGSLSMSVYNESDSSLTIDHVQTFNADRIVEGGGTVTNSYCLDNANINGEHYDCIYANGSQNITALHDTLLNAHGQTAAIFIDDWQGITSTTDIENSILAGGGYTLYGGGTERTGLITVKNNRFSRLYWPNSGQYGWDAYFPANHTVWSGNVWDDTNQTVPGP